MIACDNDDCQYQWVSRHTGVGFKLERRRSFPTPYLDPSWELGSERRHPKPPFASPQFIHTEHHGLTNCSHSRRLSFSMRDLRFALDFRSSI